MSRTARAYLWDNKLERLGLCAAPRRVLHDISLERLEDELRPPLAPALPNTLHTQCKRRREREGYREVLYLWVPIYKQQRQRQCVNAVLEHNTHNVAHARHDVALRVEAL